jgi:hypothetical protein
LTGLGLYKNNKARKSEVWDTRSWPKARILVAKKVVLGQMACLSDAIVWLVQVSALLKNTKSFNIALSVHGDLSLEDGSQASETSSSVSAGPATAVAHDLRLPFAPAL